MFDGYSNDAQSPQQKQKIKLHDKLSATFDSFSQKIKEDNEVHKKAFEQETSVRALQEVERRAEAAERKERWRQENLLFEQELQEQELLRWQQIQEKEAQKRLPPAETATLDAHEQRARDQRAGIDARVRVYEPLLGKGWLDYPYYFGVFGGGGRSFFDEHNVNGYAGGFTIGRHKSDHWGREFRVLQSASSFGGFDVSVLWYPLNTVEWRPYVRFGVGVYSGETENILRGGAWEEERKGGTAIPLGAGLHYWCTERLAVQVDVTDSIIFGEPTTHNFTFTTGIILRIR